MLPFLMHGHTLIGTPDPLSFASHCGNAACLLQGHIPHALGTNAASGSCMMSHVLSMPCPGNLSAYSLVNQPLCCADETSHKLRCPPLLRRTPPPHAGFMPSGLGDWHLYSRTPRVGIERRLKKARCRRQHVMSEEQRINVCKTSLTQIYEMFRSTPSSWRNFLGLARTIISHLDSTTFMQQANRSQEQVWVIAGLQRLAYMEPDSGGVTDLAAWCLRQWLVLCQRDPQNLAALRGIGQAWLSRAQPMLANIQRIEGSPSSSASAGSYQRSVRSVGNGREDDQNSEAAREAERRAGTAEYVEARGYLQPATDYLERAIAVATAQRIVSGDLLATTAEAYMSLGNSTSPRLNERYFKRALQLLRAASEIEGYTLSRYLQQYLDDYGRLVE